jgi:thiol-disulfide isomerase/thioredoxin
MRIFRHIAAFAVLAIISASALAKDSPYYRWIDMQPPIAVPAGPIEMQGGTRSLADFKGKVVLLNLWATWCVPCLKELPTLDALEKTRGGEGLVVIPLSLDSLPFEALRRFFDKQKLTLPHLALDAKGEVSEALTWQALPMTFLINREGQVIAHFAGATDWVSQENLAVIDKALKR